MYWKSTILIAATNEDGKTGRGCDELKWLKDNFEPDPKKGRCVDTTYIGNGKKFTICLCDANMCNKSFF